MKRRKLLVLAGGSLTTALAGCSGGGDSDDESDDTDTPADESTAESTDDGEMETETDAGDETDTGEETETPMEEETETDEGMEPDAEISLTTPQFNPSFLEVESGATVQWVGEQGSHTVTFYHSDNGTQQRVPEGVDAVDASVSSGETTAFTFSEPGVYDYFCRPHHGQGMVGSIVVGNNDAADQPGLSEPSGSLPGSAQSALEELNNRARVSLGLETVSITDAVAEANNVITELNSDSERSLSTVNQGLENVDDIELIGEVQAETESEATEAASRLRDEVDRLREAMFTQVPKEINIQAQEEVGFDLVEPDEINGPETARSSASDIEGLGDAAAQAAEALRAVADLYEKIESELTRVAGMLENATAG